MSKNCERCANLKEELETVIYAALDGSDESAGNVCRELRDNYWEEPFNEDRESEDEEEEEEEEEEEGLNFG